MAQRRKSFALVLTVVLAVVALLPLRPGRAAPAPRSADPTAHTPETVADLARLERQVTELVDRSLPCIVSVWIGSAWGTGVVISEDGKILTAGHVAGRTGRYVRVRFPDGTEYSARTLGSHAKTDMGLIQIEDKKKHKKKFAHLELGDSSDVLVGDWCVAVGYPDAHRRGRKSLVRLGRVIDLEKLFIRTDCPLVGGDSGGPLLNLAGQVIGIHSRILLRQTQNYHVPINEYDDDWDRVIDLPGKGPILGLEGSDAPGRSGCRVERVLKGFPAARMGLRKRDVITRVDDERIKTVKDLTAYIATLKAGDEITVRIKRRGRLLTRKGTLVARERQP